MIESWYRDFQPDDDVPLVVEFVSHAKSHGFTSRIRFDSWDFELHRGWTEDFRPYGLIKTVKNAVTPKVLELILREEAPLKVILVEGERFSFDNLENHRLFMASTGTGLYARGIGWVVLPGIAKVETQKDLRLRLSKAWKQDPDGNWLKTCSKCGKPQPPSEFYRNYRNNARDPYQSRCKTCWRKSSKDAYHASKGAK